MPKAASPRKRAVSKEKPSTRHASRCSKCEGRPLRSQCEHTSVGRVFLESQHTEAQQAKQRRCRRCPGNPPQSECCHTAKGRELLDARRAQEALEVIQQPSPPEAETPPRQASRPAGSSFSNATEFPVPENLQVGGDTCTDPFQQATNNSIPSGLPATPLSDGPSPYPNTSSTDPSSSTFPTSSPASVEQLSTPCPSQENATRLYAKEKASMRNPIYGVIRGAKRGNTPYLKFRTHKLSRPLKPSDDISSRFARQIPRLLQKCEDLATETGCWLFLGAQHVTARGGAINYASPRIVREAKPAADQMADLFNATASQLLSARRTDAVTFQRQLEDALNDKAAVEKEVEEANAIIAEYEKKFGCLGGA